MAWIFSNERLFKKISFLSFGKLRGSYGSTGNDQIGDYKFLDSWTATSIPYQGIPGLRPTRLFNPDFAWEVNRKLEAAMELGFLQNRLLLSAAFFRNRSSNQLISYSLPVQTGFGSVLQNFPAELQNTGFEFTVEYKGRKTTRLQWETSASLSIPRNKLLSFPGIESSSYANIYIVGQPLSVINGFRFLGVDPATGIYQFEDANKDGLLDRSDYRIAGYRGPQYYGGLSNSIFYKGFDLSFFIDFRKQTGSNYLSTISSAPPGRGANNQPVLVLNRWQKPGDIQPIQRFGANAGTPAFLAISRNLITSDALYSDASFIRGKNLALSYSLDTQLLQKIKVQALRVYIQAQNMFTITSYKGADPENQNLYVLPPLKTIAFGIQLTF